MYTNQPTLDELKASLDIVEVAEMYGELIKAGANYKFKNDPSVIISPSKQIFSDYGARNIRGGSVLDLIMTFEGLETKPAINRLKELAGQDTYHINPAKQIQRKQEADKKKKSVSFRHLGLWSKNDLEAVKDYTAITVDTGDEETSYLQMKEPFIKLFETDKLPIGCHDRLHYAYQKILGYDNYYKCPSIIIRDMTGKIVDKSAYRPNRPENIPIEKWDSKAKYFYKNFENRGKNFLYPFQAEVEKLLSKNNYFVVGEGLKNALNGYIHAIPFISLESTSNEASKDLIKYVHDLLGKGYKIVAFFDGDKAGAPAFEKFKEHARLPELENAVMFDSGQDFAEFAVKAKGGEDE